MRSLASVLAVIPPFMYGSEESEVGERVNIPRYCEAPIVPVVRP